MTLFGPILNLLLTSCCIVEVVNGGLGFLLEIFFLMLPTLKLELAHISNTLYAFSLSLIRWCSSALILILSAKNLPVVL